ncbi:hypothetical protein LTS14_007662 [Recurvomyces mirabilis]|nr:hypothetical protein LTS14_007662 [Recurvomyces mirabilis]
MEHPPQHASQPQADQQSSDQSTASLCLRTIWLFQAIVASPIFVILGIQAIINMFHTYTTLYEFITHLCTSLLAGTIIFLVLVQRKMPASKTTTMQTLNFEAGKALCAELLWLWLLLDAIFGPESHYGYYDGRGRRIAVAVITVVPTALLFYPTVFWAVREHLKAIREEAAPTSEQTPLLRNQEAA